jgi:hypothetical protein
VNVRATWLVLAISALGLVPPSLDAQDSWTLRLASEFGQFLSTRDLGKNVAGISELHVLQVSARMDRASVLAGGVEAVTPDGRTMFRGIVRASVQGTASATIALCNVVEGELCIPREVDATMVSFLGEAVFLQGSPDDTFRQNFVLGVGLRSYQFTATACDPNVSNPDLFIICEFVLPIYENQSRVQPFLEFGFGVSVGSGPISLSLRLNGIVGPYTGGSGRAEGDYQTDAFLMGGLSFRVR